MSFVVELVEVVLRYNHLEQQKADLSAQVSTFKGQKATADKNLDYYDGTLKHNGETMSAGERKDYEARKAAALSECTALAQSLHSDESSLGSVISEIDALDRRKSSIILAAYAHLELANVEGIRTLAQAREQAKSVSAEDKGQVRKTIATDDSSKLVLRPKLTFASLADVLMQLAFDIADFTTAGTAVRLFVHDKLADYEMPLLFSSWEQRFNQCVYQSKEKVASLHASLASIINNCPQQTFAKILANDPVRWTKLIAMVDVAFKQLVLVENINRALSLYSRVFSGKHPRELFTVNFKLSPQCRTVIVPPLAQLTTTLSAMMSKSMFSICPSTSLFDLVSIRATTSSAKAVDPYLKYCQEYPSTTSLLAALDGDIISCVDGITEATCKIEDTFGHLWSPDMTQKTSYELNAAAINFELEHYPRRSIKDAILLNSFPLQDATISMIRIQIDNSKDKEFKKRLDGLSGEAGTITFEGMRSGDLPDDDAVLAASRYTYTNPLVVSDPLKYAQQLIQKMTPQSPTKMAASPPRAAAPPSSGPSPTSVQRTPPQPADRNILSPRNKYESVYVPPVVAPLPLQTPEKKAAPEVKETTAAVVESPVQSARVSSARNKPRTVEPLRTSALESLRLSTTAGSGLPSIDTRSTPQQQSPPKAPPLATVTPPRPTIAPVVDKAELTSDISSVSKPQPRAPEQPTQSSLPPVVDSGRGRVPPTAPVSSVSQGASPITKMADRTPNNKADIPLRNSPPKAQSSPRESTAYSIGRLNSGGNKAAFAPPGRIGSASQIPSLRGSTSSRPPSQGTLPSGTVPRTPVRVFQNTSTSASSTTAPDSGRHVKNAWSTPPRALIDKNSPTTKVEEVANASAYKNASSRATNGAYPSPTQQMKAGSIYNETTRASHNSDSYPSKSSSIPREGRSGTTATGEVPHYTQPPSTAPTGSTRTNQRTSPIHTSDPKSSPVAVPSKEENDDEALLAALMKKEKASLDRIRQIKERDEERRKELHAAHRQAIATEPAPSEEDRVKALEAKLEEENRRREERKNIERAETERVREALDAEKFKEMEQRFERRNTPPPIQRVPEAAAAPPTTTSLPRPDSALRRKLSLPSSQPTSVETTGGSNTNDGGGDALQGIKMPPQPTPPSVPPPSSHLSGRKPSTAPVSSLFDPANSSAPLISPRELSKMSLLDAYKQFCSRLGMKPNSGILKLLPTTPGEFISNINLDLNYIGVRGFKPLLEVLRINRGLRFLNLKDNNLENSEVKALVSVLLGESGGQLAHIDLSNNPISLAGGSSLMDLVNRQKALTTVVLKGTLIQQKVVEKILEAASANSN